MKKLPVRYVYSVKGKAVGALPAPAWSTKDAKHERTFSVVTDGQSVSDVIEKVTKLEQELDFWEDDGHYHNSKSEQVDVVDRVIITSIECVATFTPIA